MGRFNICKNYYYCSQIQEDKMGGMCSMHGKKKEACNVVEKV